MALSLLLVPNEHRRADEKNRESVIEKATIVTLVRITKLAIEKKDLDQAALLETVDLLKRNTQQNLKKSMSEKFWAFLTLTSAVLTQISSPTGA